MAHGRDDALPVEALRDLIGVVRALYRSVRDDKGSPIALEDLRTIDTELVEALKLAERCEPGTLGHVAAWGRTERATELLGKLIQESMPLQPSVEAAVARAMTPQPSPGESDRPSREQARRIRRQRS